MLSRSAETLRRAILLALGGVVVVASATLGLGIGVAAADVNTPPDPPSAVTASVSSAGITFNWTAPTNTGTDGSGDPATISGYNVYVATSSGGEVAPAACSASAPSTTCEVTGLTPGDTYYYEATSVNSGGIETPLPTSESSIAFVPAPDVTLSSDPAAPTYLAGGVTLTATLDLAAPGTVDFLVNGEVACAGQVVATSSPPYTATCAYTPVSSSSFSVDANFTPTDPTTYAASSATQITVPVTAATPSLSLGASPTSPSYDETTTLSATSSAVGTFDFSADGASIGCDAQPTSTTPPYTATCSWTPSSVGAPLIVATFTSGDPDYASGASTQTTVIVTEASQQALSITSTAGTYGTALTLTTAGGSGNGNVQYSVDPGGSAAGCSIVDDQLSVTSAGTCFVTAVKESDGDYQETDSPSTEITFASASQQDLTLTSLNGTYGDAVTLSASGGSGSGGLSYALDAGGSAAGCLVVGDQLSATSTGTCFVTATKAADGDYLAAQSPSTAVTFAPADQQALTLTSTAGTYGSTLTLVATGGSSTGGLSYSLDDPGTADCTLVNDQLSASSTGTCLVTATRAADSDYLAVESSPTTVDFAPASQGTLTLSTTSGTYGTTLTLLSSGGSGSGVVTYALDSGGSATGCALVGDQLSVQSTGTCVVTATKAADSDYLIASSVPTQVTFYESAQSPLALTSTSGTFGSALTLTASGGSGGGAVTYALDAGGSAAGCHVTTNQLSVTGAGTCVVTATKAADGNYGPVNSSPTTVTFAQASQAPLAITSTSGTYGSALTLTTSGGSGTGAITFAVSDGSATGCQVSATSLISSSAGTCDVKATKAADHNYLEATSSSATVTLARAIQPTLVVTSTSGVWGSAISLRSEGGAGSGAVTFSLSGGSATHCTLSGTALRAASAGTCELRATKAADTDYVSASSVLTTVTFTKAAPSRLRLTSTSGTYGVALVLTVRGGGGGALRFRVTDVTARGCREVSLDGHARLTTTSAGTCRVTVSQASDRDYRAGASAPTTVTFARARQAPLVLTSVRGSVGESLTLTWRGGSGTGVVRVSVANGTATKCSLTGDALSVAAAGTCRVTLVKGGDSDYVAVSANAATVIFSPRAGSPLILNGSSAPVGSPRTLATSGGSGTGVVSFTLEGGTSTTCVLNGSVLRATSPGTCLVTATKAGDATYRASTSSLATFTFVKKSTPLVITASPTTQLRSGDHVDVAGHGFTPGEHVVIVECDLGATSASQCDLATERSVVIPHSGVLATTAITVVSGRVGSRVCGVAAANLSSCEVRVSQSTFANARALGLHFAVIPTGRTLRVTPSTDLRNGEVVTLSGSGFTPHDRVYYAECLIGSINESRCDLATYKSVIITSSGDFPPTRVTLATGQVGTATCGTSVSDLSACDISVANSSLGDAAVANLTFVRP